MEYISLDKDPNQAFTIFTNGMTLTITLQWFRGLMYYSIDTVGGENIVSSERECNGSFLLPQRFEKSGDGGNLCFIDDNGDYPDYRNFNGSCVLVRYNQEEVDAIRASWIK